jgi:hypothetical protein
MRMNYLLIGLVVLVAVVPQTGLAQGFCHWSYSSGQSICNTNSGDVHIRGSRPFLVLVDEQEEGNISSAISWSIGGNTHCELFYDDGAAHWAFYDTIGEVERVVIERDTGNVGIGVTSPVRTLHVKDVMRLEPQSSAPSGGLGDLYASTGGKLYFHNGSDWQEIDFAP